MKKPAPRKGKGYTTQAAAAEKTQKEKPERQRVNENSTTTLQRAAVNMAAFRISEHKNIF